MKFGKYLRCSVSPQWQRLCVDYRGLKKLIGRGPSHEEFLTALTKERLKIVDFHLLKCTELKKALDEAMETLREGNLGTSRLRFFHALRYHLTGIYHDVERLESFDAINSLAFYKIIKKYRKSSANEPMDPNDPLILEVNSQPFHESRVLDGIKRDLTFLYASTFTRGNVNLARKQLQRRHVFPTVHDELRFGLQVGFQFGVIACGLYLVFIRRSFWTTGGRLELPDFGFAFPIFRGLFLMLLLVWLWGSIVLRTFAAYRINHYYILELDEASALSWVGVLGVASTLGSIFVLFLFLWVVGLEVATLYYIPSQYCFLAVLVALAAFFFCPFPIWEYSTRVWLMRRFVRIALAPFFAVHFADSLVADILTSLVKVATDWVFTLCFYFSGGAFRGTPSTSACVGVTLTYIAAVIMALPFFWRAMQALRMWIDTRAAMPHCLNLVKYVLSLMAVLAGVLYNSTNSQGRGLPMVSHLWLWTPWGITWFVLFLVSSLLSFFYDVFLDWGLGRIHSKNFLLRDELFFTRHWVYWAAIALDFVGRFFWGVTISSQLIFRNTVLITVFAAGEVFRRCMWVIFRVENECIHNFEHYRHVDYVPPLPVGGMPHLDFLTFPKRPVLLPTAAPKMVPSDQAADYLRFIPISPSFSSFDRSLLGDGTSSSSEMVEILQVLGTMSFILPLGLTMLLLWKDKLSMTLANSIFCSLNYFTTQGPFKEERKKKGEKEPTATIYRMQFTPQALARLPMAADFYSLHMLFLIAIVWCVCSIGLHNFAPLRFLPRFIAFFVIGYSICEKLYQISTTYYMPHAKVRRCIGPIAVGVVVFVGLTWGRYLPLGLDVDLTWAWRAVLERIVESATRSQKKMTPVSDLLTNSISSLECPAGGPCPMQWILHLILAALAGILCMALLFVGDFTGPVFDEDDLAVAEGLPMTGADPPARQAIMEFLMPYLHWASLPVLWLLWLGPKPFGLGTRVFLRPPSETALGLFQMGRLMSALFVALVNVAMARGRIQRYLDRAHILLRGLQALDPATAPTPAALAARQQQQLGLVEQLPVRVFFMAMVVVVPWYLLACCALGGLAFLGEPAGELFAFGALAVAGLLWGIRAFLWATKRIARRFHAA
ncbi:putative xenotropic and polytropic retrovirus receptor 1 [Paratrimastix pyriformis]|uniref:Xenotropic and polytropic retrovirus receptor 1 n=1 Tax=Paratrimastix pyriformis TaxID=342808 RepID=A0ABQ8UTS3_9EUKA|nr:putative xenotropic and polytropic retrovirus receptor 1 [Paratrimastix pyriformis]